MTTIDDAADEISGLFAKDLQTGPHERLRQLLAKLVLSAIKNVEWEDGSIEREAQAILQEQTNVV